MPTFADYFSQTANAQRTDLVIDLTWQRLMSDLEGIRSLIPVTTHQDWALFVNELTEWHADGILGQLVAEGQQIPTTRSNRGITERQYRSICIGKAIQWNEQDYKQLASLQYASQSLREAIENSFFVRQKNVLPGIENLATVFALQIACGLPIDYTDPITGARYTYTQPGMIPSHIPAPLVGPAQWSNPSTCAPLTNLRAISEATYGVTPNTSGVGAWPNALLIHQEQFEQIRNSNQLRRYLMSVSGNTATTEADTLAAWMPSDEQVMNAIKAYTRVGTVIPFDARFLQQGANGVDTMIDALPVGMICFLYTGNIRKSYVPVLNASGEFTNGQPAFTTVSNNDIPFTEKTTGIANVIPFAIDGRAVAAQKVV